MADRLLTEDARAYLFLDDLKPKIQNAKTDDQRAELLLQAAKLMKKADPEERIAFLRRVTVECPQSPKTANAWVLLINIKLNDKKNRKPPTEEVTALIRVIQEMGIGPDKVDAKIIKSTINKLKKKKFKELAEELAKELAPKLKAGSS
ncbi:MAG: hypothetical protein K8S55_10010 [Phycisphaerae bacterium]|nr:hypothetical protein [Phycisphaerae bacterium]